MNNINPKKIKPVFIALKKEKEIKYVIISNIKSYKTRYEDDVKFNITDIKSRYNMKCNFKYDNQDKSISFSNNGNGVLFFNKEIIFKDIIVEYCLDYIIETVKFFRKKELVRKKLNAIDSNITEFRNKYRNSDNHYKEFVRTKKLKELLTKI